MKGFLIWMDGSQLLKALNVLVLNILDNADRTSSFVVLINLLRTLDPSRWPSAATNESFAARYQRFSDLVVKCLIKLTKLSHAPVQCFRLDYRPLFFNQQQYQSYSSVSITRRMEDSIMEEFSTQEDSQQLYF
ncbi:protein MOR1-like [Mangifera indica]|uniref:protein MOR1-like n=1 Tax=Mangifera indica TaxID=29780 RepID=UPI001CFBC40C|nr:protein MOR1-like [Mangifera indica]XP_044479417.1 protein MOR1-like [Mangifera indica]